MDQVIKNMVDLYGVTPQTERFFSGKQRMFVNGEFVEAGNKETIDVIEPSTASYLTSVPSGTIDDVDRAVAAARTALREGAWATMKPAQRERLLFKLADAIENDAQTLGEIETIDNGKAIGPCIEMDILGGFRPRHLQQPVLKDADRLSLREMVASMLDLLPRAVQRKATPDELSGATFTVNNIGALGNISGTSIIPHGTTSILSVSRAIEKPVAVNGAVEIRPILEVTLSFDHRAIDGGLAQRFLNRIQENLEEPVKALL